MEKNLNLRKLFLMYLKNAWIVILAGIIFAGVVFVAKKGDNSATKNVTETVSMAFEIHDGIDEGTYSRRTVYFDNFRGLISGNAISASDAFTEDEKEILKDITTKELSGTFTVTIPVSSDMSDEAASELMDKYIAEAEKWMRDAVNDTSFKLNVLNKNVEDIENGNALKLAAIFFIIGCLLAVIVMFFIFVVETVIHDADDLEYYIGVSPIFEIGKSKSFAIDEIAEWIISSGKKSVMLLGNQSAIGVSDIAEETVGLLNKCGKKATIYNIGSDFSLEETENKLTEEKSNNDIVLLTPPALAEAPAALHIASLCDLIILNVDADCENGVKLKKKVKNLSDFGIVFDSAVFNYGTKNKFFRL